MLVTGSIEIMPSRHLNFVSWVHVGEKVELRMISFIMLLIFNNHFLVEKNNEYLFELPN